MTQRVSVSLPEASGAPGSKGGGNFGAVVSTLLALILGGAGGWFGHLYVEGSKETAFHAERLKPFVAYDSKFYEKRARSLNDDMRRVQFLLHAAVADGCDLEAVLDAAMPTTQVPPALKKLTIDRLVENYQQGEEYGLHTAENLALLFEGRSPTITLGELAGERADVEHIVPKSVVPNVDNLLLNLEWLASSLNQSKGNKITDRAMEYARRYKEAGIMRDDDFAEVEMLHRERK